MVVDAGRGFDDDATVLDAVLSIDWTVVFGTAVVLWTAVVFDGAVVVVVRLLGFFVTVELAGVGDGDVNVVSENRTILEIWQKKSDELQFI